MGGFYASFEKFNDLSGSFDGTVETMGDVDPFEDSADVDPTGLENELDALEEANVIDDDDNTDDETEDLDDDDIEFGEEFDEDMLNEVDLDFEADDIEPDWNPEDAADVPGDPTDISDEDETADTQLDDEPYDQWSEVSPQEEISQDDDVSEEDDIWQGEETGYDEPLFYPDEDDFDQDPTDDALEDILYHQDDLTDNIVDEIESAGRFVQDAGQWVDNLEDFLDFTEQDVSSFHDVQDGLEITDGYDPPDMEFMGDAILELPNLVDDVFANVFPDPIGNAFSFFDSFG